MIALFSDVYCVFYYMFCGFVKFFRCVSIGFTSTKNRNRYRFWMMLILSYYIHLVSEISLKVNFRWKSLKGINVIFPLKQWSVFLRFNKISWFKTWLLRRSYSILIFKIQYNRLTGNDTLQILENSCSTSISMEPFLLPLIHHFLPAPAYISVLSEELLFLMKKSDLLQDKAVHKN